MRTAPSRNRAVRSPLFRNATYTSIWEDERIIERGLRPGRGDRILCITSGGCFSLQCLLGDVEQVVSVDANPFQTALLELKRVAARGLGAGELWAFLGLSPSRDRRRVYRDLRALLPDDAASWWDARPKAIAHGVALTGKRDRWLHRAGRLATLLQGRRVVHGLLACATLAEQRAFVDREWDRARWRWAMGLLLSGAAVRWAVRPDGPSPAEALRREIDHLLREIPVADNFYLHYLFQRTYASDRLCPSWLRSDTLPVLKGRLDRLVCVTAPVEEYLARQDPRTFDGFYLSNIFDWGPPEEGDGLMAQIVRVARPGARICYWTNTLNRPYVVSPAQFPEVASDPALGAAIHAASRVPGYSTCTVATVGA